MRKITSEIVDLFWEGDVPVGMLLMNGGSHFFRVEPASKVFVREELLDTESRNHDE